MSLTVQQNSKSGKEDHYLSWPAANKSTSGTGSEALLPVQLDPKLKSSEDYTNVFFPRRVPPKSSRTQRKNWPDLAKYLCEVSAFVNATLEESRYLVTQAKFLTTLTNDQRTYYTKNYMNEVLGKVAPSDANDKEAAKRAQAAVASVQSIFLSTIGSGTKHIIRPSKKYKGGYDIIYSGLPATSSLPGTAASFNVTPDGNEKSALHDWKIDPTNLEAMAPGGKLTLPTSQVAIEMSKQLLNGLFKNAEASELSTAHQRLTVQVPLDFDFASVISEASKAVSTAKLGLDVSRLSKCPSIPADVLAGLKDYFSILVIREANLGVVKAKINNPAYDVGNVYSKEAFITKAVVGFSIVMHLPAEIVGFITQTKPGQKVPLTALNTWASVWSRAALRMPRQKLKKGEPGSEKQSRTTFAKAPRYVLSASATGELAARRKSLGFFTEEGRSNADDLFVSNIGTLNFCPKSGALALDNAKNYETLLEDALQISFDAGSPLAVTSQGETNPVFGLASPAYKERIAKLKDNITKYKGSMQSYSWDYNVILTTALSDPEKLNAVDLAGAARPDELSLTDYLKKPFCKSMQLLFVESRIPGDKGSKAVGEETFGKGGSPSIMLKSSLFVHTFDTYAYLMNEKENVVPSLQELVTESAKDLGIVALDQGEDTPVLEKNLYTNIIKNNLTVVPTLEDRLDPKAQMDAVVNIMTKVLKDAAGGANSNLARLAYSKGGIPADEPMYFDAEDFTLADFKNVYHYLGGRIFYNMMRHLHKVDQKKLLVLNIENPLEFPNFTAVVREVMPLATILSRYVPEAEAIYEKAEVLAAGNVRDSSISVNDIHVPGSRGPSKNHEGFQLFPHQIEGQQYLRNAPRFAVLDVAPGGGKTIAVVTDIGCLVAEKRIRRPLVLCPNGLVKNWVEDAHKVTEGKWNIIPITKDSYRLWGDERLTKMLLKAPPNTIVVVGLSVLKLDKYPVVIGTHVEMVSETLEFIKKFGFDYVAIDESHRVKNPKSATHKTVKQLCVASSVKYIRLATGTLISNTLLDVVGQAAMFNSQIFRTPQEYDEEHMVFVGENKKGTYRPDTAEKARKQLSRHAAVITAKRKEWAFMLPLPIEEFISVGMTKRTHYSEGPGDPDGPIDEKAGGAAHQLMYNTMLTQVMEELKADTEIKQLLSGSSDDDDADDDDDDDEVDLTDLDDATLAELQMKLNPYLQRLEMMLTDPLHSDVGQIYFDKINKKDFVSNKVLKVIERIRMNFKAIPWVKGKTYEIKDICDVGDKRFVLMPPKDAKFGTAEYRADYVSKISPDQDPRWKPEPHGKVIVFCRYTSTVNCIYDNLPADLKKLAVKFHGEIKERWEYLDGFKAQPIGRRGIQILIANEQSISEGHNLQMANRLIRVEAPWAPGELDQAASRIFRPDPSGNFSRENVYLDWILTDNSLEVAKMGRLISKMIIKAQFDEAHNPLYENVRKFELPLISMSLKTLGDTPTLSSIEEYTNAYGELIRIQASEFAEMRATKPSTMTKVPETPIEEIEGQEIITYTPYVANQDVPDRNNFGLVKLNSYLQNNDNPEVLDVLADGKKLIGKFAHTEMGNGTIINVTLGDVDKSNPNAPRKISRVWVKFEGQEDVYKGDPSFIWLATNMTASTIKEFALKTPWATKGDIARAEKVEKRAAIRAAKEAIRAKKQKAKEKATLAKLKEIEKLQKATSKKKAKPEPEPVEEDEENNNVALYPVVYNGFLAIEAITEDHTIEMKPHGFTHFGEYAYAPIKDIQSFEAVLKYLKSKFLLKKPILSKIEGLRSAFLKKFASEEVDNVAEFKNFYRLRHTLSQTDEDTGKTELKVYPVILNNVLMLNIDLGTNPKFRRHLNKVIPGSKAVKFKETDGLDIIFLNSKAQLLSKAKEMEKEGFVITNYDEFKAEVKTINPKMKNI